MKKLICLFIFCFQSLLGQEITGFWKTINDKSGKPESIIAIYEHDGKYFGRIIATYNDQGKIQDTIANPKEKAKGVQGNPYYSGLDIIWDLTPNGTRFSQGKILDPEKGRIYDAEMWRQGSNLIVRGEVWVFGENQEWVPASDSDFPRDFSKPDIAKFTPVIPKKL